MANLWTLLGCVDACLVFTALEELKSEAVGVQNADVPDAPEKMKTMQETLENVLEEVKTVNGFWSLNDQDVVRASLMEYASISGKARKGVRSMAASASKAQQIDRIDRIVYDKMLAQDLALKNSNEKLWMSIGGFVLYWRLRSRWAQ